MATDKQKIGEYGEILVCKICICPRCKREKTLRRLPANFECADLICKFCTFVAQVKTSRVTNGNVNKIPPKVVGAAWKPQKERMESSIYIPLFLVLINPINHSEYSIYYLPTDSQKQTMFKPRSKPLSEKAKRAGWLGFDYNFLEEDKKLFVNLTSK